MKRLNIIEKAMINHQIVILIVVCLVILGIVALIIMPKQEFPTFTVRQGLIIGVYPGATSKQVEEQLTKPLENFIFQFKEIDKSKTVSQSCNGIVYIVTEINDQVKNKDAFWAQFKLRINELKATLPKGVLAIVVKDDFGDSSSILITMESEQKTYKELYSHFSELEDRLRSIDAISDLQIYGMQKEQITVYINPEKLSKYAINTSTLSLKLLTQGFTTLSGSISNNEYNAPIYISESYNSIKDIEEQIVFSDIDGNVIRLKDIATIVKEFPKPTSYIKNNGTKSILLSMQMREGHNIVKFGYDVNKVLNKFEKELPDDIKMYHITDQPKVVQDSVAEFLKELLIAIISVIIVVMLLMPLKIASIAAMTIPITIFISIGVFFMCGIELNTVTFATLLVTLGMVVDDSIVIIDCYVGKLDEGVPRWQASRESTHEFFKSIVSATLAISITFFPFLFTTKGLVVDFLDTFPWSITIILMFSFLVAILLIPYLQYFIIRKGIKSQDSTKQSKTFLNFMQNSHTKLLKICFKNPILTISTGIIISVLGAVLLLNLPLKLLPIADRFQFAVEISTPEGTSLEKTAIIADSMANILKNDERIISVTTFYGESSPRFHTLYTPHFPGSNFAQFIINTKGNKETIEILDEYADKYCHYFPNARIVFKQLEYSFAVNPIEVRLSSNSKDDLKKYASILTDTLRNINELLYVYNDIQNYTFGASININSDEMARLGVNKSIVSLNTAINFSSGIPITTLWDGSYYIPVVIKTELSDNSNFCDISNELVIGYGGLSSIPLRQFATVEPTWTPTEISHHNGIPTITIRANAKRGNNILGLTKHIKKIVNDMNIPDNITIKYGGEEENTMFFFPQILKGLICSIVIIFFILLFHLKKINLTLLLLASILFCLPGASLGLWIMGMDLSITSILGLVSLMGVLVRNGIIMIDYAEELRIGGLNIKDAAFHSATRRMRPIFLTSAAASMGVIPMIIGRSSLWSPMGTIIFFGTWLMMFLVLTVLPVAYWKVFERSDRRAKATMKKAIEVNS